MGKNIIVGCACGGGKIAKANLSWLQDQPWWRVLWIYYLNPRFFKKKTNVICRSCMRAWRKCDE